MSVTLQQACHPACIVCRSREDGGLEVRFELQPDGSALGYFDCEDRLQGYPDRLHGGIVSLLLDAAMTHCLFLHEIVGVTGRLNISFREPVDVGRRAEIRGAIVSHAKNLYRMKAELRQDDVVRATAEAKFMANPRTLSREAKSDEAE